MTADDSTGRVPFAATLILIMAVVGMSTYANLPHLLGARALLALVPPFEYGYDLNMVDHLGGENLEVARSLVRGEGFSSPFGGSTGPTAWIPPLYPTMLAAMFLILGTIARVTVAIVVLQDLTLIATGWIILESAARLGSRRSSVTLALGSYIGLMLYHFHSCFMLTHDTWLVMFCIGYLFRYGSRPGLIEESQWGWAAWGAAGAVCVFVTPVLGLVWVCLTIRIGCGRSRLGFFARSFLIATVIAAPWVARNYVTFGRFIPVKSNLFYELYQSNCLEPDGVLRQTTSASHPYINRGEAREDYAADGEIAYIEKHRQIYLASLVADPFGAIARVVRRLAAATVVYHPFADNEKGYSLRLSTIVHPLPFYALVLVLMLRLGPGTERGTGAVIYVAYLTPYVLVSYYERYAVALLGIQALFCFRVLEAVIPCPNSPTPPIEEAAMSDSLNTFDLSVIIPVFNEARTIAAVLDAVAAAPFDMQIIVVDDGSTDGTAAVLDNLTGSGRREIELVRHERNRGKGAAIRTGLTRARGRVTLVQDADLEYDPADYPAMVRPILDGEVVVVFGSRYASPVTPLSWTPNRCCVGLLNILVRVLYGRRIGDEATGYKAFATDVLRQMDLRCERFEFCPEATAKVARMGLEIREVPISYHPRTHAQGKKIRWWDGVEAIATLIRWRFATFRPITDPASFRRGGPAHRPPSPGDDAAFHASLGA